MSHLPACMRGVVLTGFGELNQLHYRSDLAVPQPGAQEVLIRVGAAAVNNTDINVRIGWYNRSGDGEAAGWSGQALQLPRIQGADVCGEVVALGAGVAPERLGQRVLIDPCLWLRDGKSLQQPWYLGYDCDGGFAEYVCVPDSNAHAVYSALSDSELASFPCSYSTAENLLTRARVRPGDTVLVTGASGGVGSAAVQLAKARGARVLAVTSANKAADLIDLGAEQVLDRQLPLREQLADNSVDVVIDLVGGEQWPHLLDVLKPHGRYAVSGAIGGAHVGLDLRTLYLKDLSFFGCTVLEPGVFAQLIARIEQGQIKPLVAACYPLKDIAQAQQAFLAKQHVGKIVLTVA